MDRKQIKDKMIKSRSAWQWWRTNVSPTYCQIFQDNYTIRHDVELFHRPMSAVQLPTDAAAAHSDEPCCKVEHRRWRRPFQTHRGMWSHYRRRGRTARLPWHASPYCRHCNETKWNEKCNDVKCIQKPT